MPNMTKLQKNLIATNMAVVAMTNAMIEEIDIKIAAIEIQTATVRMMIVASALMSGLRPVLMREKIRIGKVFAPGPVTKLAMTRSSSESVNANNQPETSAGVRRGSVIAVRTLNGLAPRSAAASSKVSPIPVSRA